MAVVCSSMNTPVPAERDAAIGQRQAHYALAILFLVYMFNFLDRQILAILLPAIREEFQASDTVLGLLAGTAFALFYALAGVPIARLSDQWSRRNVLVIGLSVWSLLTACSGAR